MYTAVYCSLFTLYIYIYASYYDISDKSVETAESHTASCHLEINQLAVQHGTIFIFSLQLYPSATAAQTLDNTESSSRGGITADLPFDVAHARSVLVAKCVRYPRKIQYTSPSSSLSSMIHKCLISHQVGSHYRYHSLFYPTTCRKLQ